MSKCYVFEAPLVSNCCLCAVSCSTESYNYLTVEPSEFKISSNKNQSEQGSPGDFCNNSL